MDISRILSKHASDTLLISSTEVLQQFRESKSKVEAQICKKNKQSLKETATSSASGSGTEDNVKGIS
ncbi:hypothetical protein PsorP6_002989 [Peronosclerospora sorghi]|uniref:Uncharacterized protein n=1 Tax=Peronosclerospora sorghi TaxID=230839 RepID=A0ACC0VI49_9STRA|nr:hypothetical protein PsorP6_002989 [Peronosclerospora sorghi]